MLFQENLEQILHSHFFCVEVELEVGKNVLIFNSLQKSGRVYVASHVLLLCLLAVDWPETCVKA